MLVDSYKLASESVKKSEEKQKLKTVRIESKRQSSRKR